MKSTVKVKITLEDVCDSKPKFEKDPYVVFLDEDVRMRSNVVTVKAVSQDLVQDGEIFYSIVSGNDPLTFVIQKNGVIVIKRLLDYETNSEYILIESRIIKSKKYATSPYRHPERAACHTLTILTNPTPTAH